MPSFLVEKNDLPFEGEVSGENFERIVARIEGGAALNAGQLKQVVDEILCLIPSGCAITAGLIKDIISGLVPGQPDTTPVPMAPAGLLPQ